MSNGNPLDLVLSVTNLHIPDAMPDCSPPRVRCSCGWALLGATIEGVMGRWENHVRVAIEKARTETVDRRSYMAAPYPNNRCRQCGAETRFVGRQMTYVTVHNDDCARW